MLTVVVDTVSSANVCKLGLIASWLFEAGVEGESDDEYGEGRDDCGLPALAPVERVSQALEGMLGEDAAVNVDMRFNCLETPCLSFFPVSLITVCTDIERLPVPLIGLLLPLKVCREHQGRTVVHVINTICLAATGMCYLAGTYVQANLLEFPIV